MQKNDFDLIAKEIAQYAYIIKEADMREYTTFKTGGIADMLVYPSGVEDISAIIKYAKKNGVPLTVIGGGSNLLVSDKGIRGIVIRMAEDNVKKGIITIKGEGNIYADSIVRKRDFIEFSANNGYTGSEFIAGIPGCIGGGVHMNAGTFMGTFVDILDRVQYVNSNGDICEKSVTSDMAKYRELDLGDALVICGANFLMKGKKPSDEIIKDITAIIEDRKTKHPQQPSAGSVFKNPDGHFSWKLVDDAGLKGKKIGGAMVSTLHTNFIINNGGATSRDVKELIELVRSTVREKFGVVLNPEVKSVGEF